MGGRGVCNGMSEAVLATPRGDSASTAVDLTRGTESPEVTSPDLDLGACGRWQVAHCKSRQESAFAADLRRDHVQCFLPITRRISYATGRKHLVDEPLFSGYVFFAGDDEAVQIAQATRRLAMIIPVVNQASLKLHREPIRALIQAFESAIPK